MNRKVAHILAALANIAKAVSFSAAFGTTTGATSIITTATITVTVPAGNSGRLRLTNTRLDDTPNATMLYSINGAAFVTFATTGGEVVDIIITNTQTLRFRMNGATAGAANTSVVDITDLSAASTLIGTATITRT